MRPFLLSDRIPKIRKRSQDSTCPTRTTKTGSDYDGSSSRSSVGVLPRDAKFFVYSECPFQGTQYPPQDRVWTTESHLRTVKLVLEHTNCFAYRMIAFKVRKGPCVQQPPRSPYVSSFVLRTTELMHTKIRLRYILIFSLNFAHCLRPVFFKGQYPLSYAMVGVIPKNGRKGPLPRAQHPVWADSNSAMAIR